MVVEKKRKRKTRSKRKKRQVYFEPTYLRELLGLKDDVALELQRTARFNRPLSKEDAFVSERASYQPDLAADDEPERQQTPSRRFKRYWASLTKPQKDAMRLVYLKNPEKLSKAEIARKLGIRVETLQERLDYAIKKLVKFFPEFGAED